MPSVAPQQQPTSPRSSSPPPQLPPITKFHTLLTAVGMNSLEDEDGDGEQSVADGEGDADGAPSPTDSDADERSVAPSVQSRQRTRPITPPSPTRGSVGDSSFFSRTAPVGKKWLPALHPSTQPQRVNGGSAAHVVEEGIWTVSVAETKGQEGEAYTIYVKTPTHHLTLTRSTSELRELAAKLAAALPGHRLPVSPLKASTPPSSFTVAAPTSPTPRKRSFLTTVTRLVSPSRNQSPALGARSRHQYNSHLHPSEANTDPTAVAQYLTTLSNDAYVRTAKPWRRFVRVRVDDLESRRVERRVRRTRSDLAAHRAGKSGIGSIGGGISGSRTTPAGGKGLKEMMEESEEEVVQEEPLRKEPSQKKEPELERETDTFVGGEVSTLPVLSEVTSTEEGEKGEIPPIEIHAEELDPVELADSTVELLQPTPTLPTHSLEPSLTPLVQTTPLSSLTPPATPKVTPTHSHSYISDPIPLAQLPPRPASADPDSAVRHHRVWKPMTQLTHQPSETDIAETTEDDDGADATAATGEDGMTGEEGEKKKASEGGKKRVKGKKIRIEDFEMLRVLGKGCAGKVLLVKYRATGSLYALKAITKRHVLAHQELQHTLTEQAVLKRMAAAGDNANPFVVKLYWSFHDRENLFLVMDFHPGGDLATQLARWGRLGRDRARFYAAEIVEGVEGLHAAGVIYRDLKPENILIGADGHIVLTDFGLSKEFPKRAIPPVSSMNTASMYSAPGTPRSGSPFWGAASGYVDGTSTFWGGKKDRDVTSTFCGTAEYLAPEVIQGLPYSYEVDWWSFGTMLYEMLTGITPFWANNHADMYVRVLQDELCFPEDKAMDQDTKSLIRGLLQRNPALRMTEPRIKKHPYFQMIDWSHVYHKRYIPPYIPPIDPSNESDTQNFDETFLDMEPVISDEPDESEREKDPGTGTDTAETETSSVRTAGIESGLEPEDEPDLFDGYSFKGRHSMIIDPDEESIIEEVFATENGTASSGVRTSGTNTDDSRFTADSAITTSTAPTSVEEDAAVTATKPEPESITDSPTEMVGSAPTSAPDTAGTVTPAEPRTKEQVRDGEAVEDAPVTVPVVAPASPKPAIVRRVEIRTPAEPALTNALPTTPAKPTFTKTTRFKAPRHKEKSGVPALDRDFTPGRDDFDGDDDDWDLVETPHGEEANGTKGTSLFARGVVDRYRLAVFRRPNSGKSSRTPSSQIIGEGSDGTASPSPSDGKLRRGRATGLSIRRSTNQFLRPKSPVSTVSQSSSTARASLASSAVALGGGSTITRMTPPSSFHMNSSSSQLPSRSSIGSPDSSEHSLHSTDGLPRSASEHFSERERPTSPLSREKHKNLTKMKKMTEQGAEKVLSLFHSQHQR